MGFAVKDYDATVVKPALAKITDDKEKKAWLTRARLALKAVADPDDRRPIEEDLKTIR